MTPTIGRIVLYTLSAQDAEQINRRRTTGTAIAERMSYDSGDPMMKAWPAGAQAHIGNEAREGQTVPATVVAVWSDTCVNLHCLLDGTDAYWATSRNLGNEMNVNGFWLWPTRA